MAPGVKKDDASAPLQSYVQEAWNTRKTIDPFGTDRHGSSVPRPTLRKGYKNRIIYYIGSFNPPHLGHLALVDHVFSNASSASSSSPASAEELNAVALIIIPHSEYWIERKLHRAAGPSASGRRSPDLHLDFKQRYKLLREGMPDDLCSKGVWIFPEQMGEWWMFQNRLNDLCRRDRFELEFVELLGPDYVLQARPQCSGMHGVITSNVCRPADFVVDGPDGGKLIKLAGFSPWEKLGAELEPGKPVESLDGRDEKSKEELNGGTWVCRSSRNLEYNIWFVQCKVPRADPDMSSTELRRIIAESNAEELEEKVREVAMSPELLIKFATDFRKSTQPIGRRDTGRGAGKRL